MIYFTRLIQTRLNPLVSLSVADPFSGLISSPTIPREFIARLYPKDAALLPVNLDISSSGYTSLSTDTPFQFFKSHIVRPYSFTVGLPLPNLSGSTQLGVGDLVAKNADGSLDTYSLLDWVGADSHVYLGPPEPAGFGLFTRILKGVSSGVVRELDRVSVLYRDLRFKLQRTLQRRRYKGIGACIRGNGTTSLASATITCPAGSMTFECQLRPRTLANALKYFMAYQSSGAAGGRILRFDTGANNRLAWYVINDAAVLYSISADGLFPLDSNIKHIAAVLDVSALRLRLYVDGVEAATPVVISGTFNTVLSAFMVMRRPDSAASYADVDMDEIKIWPSARTQSQIKTSMAREQLGTEGQTAYWKVNEGSGGTSANAVGGGVALTLTNITWIGSLEGDPSLTGTVKPIALGKRRQVQPKWVDSQRLVAQYHDGSMQGVDAQRDKGDLLTFGSDLTDIYSSAPAAGTYNTCLAWGLVRYGSTPVGTITGDIRGANGGLIGYADSTAEIHQKLMVDYGELDIATEIDAFSHSELDSLNSAVTGEYFDTEIKIDAAADLVLQRGCNAWGGPTRIGRMTVGRIDDPNNKTATIFWTEQDLDTSSSSPFRSVPFGVRFREIVVGYRPYHTTLSNDQVAGVVSLSAKDDFGKEYRYVSQEVIGASEDADTLTVLTSMDSEADAIAELNRLLAFRGRDLEEVQVSLSRGVLSHFIGTIVSLTINQVNANGVTIQRYNTSGGKKYVVVRVEEDMGESGSPDRLRAVLIG
jgi:hypothetical protein